MRRLGIFRCATASVASSTAFCSSSTDTDGPLSRTDTEGPLSRTDTEGPLHLPTARSLARRWVEEEQQPGYMPPSASWPPPEQQPRRSDIPALRKASTWCGGPDTPGCRETTFTLAVALLGGALFGHARPDETHDETEPTAEERVQGASLLQRLAQHGMPEALCGWAMVLFDGELTERDAPAAVACHEAAAAKGFAQSQHELGSLYFTGEWSDEGVGADTHQAVRWLRMAAERGVPSSQFLLGECLLEGSGAAGDADAREAYRWFAAAGEKGHRGARQRVLDAVAAEDEQQAYARVAGRRSALWGMT